MSGIHFNRYFCTKITASITHSVIFTLPSVKSRVDNVNIFYWNKSDVFDNLAFLWKNYQLLKNFKLVVWYHKKENAENMQMYAL